MVVPAQLPEGLVSYKRTAVFNQDTVPAGLLGDHQTKEEVWGLIHVDEGSLLYRITDPRRDASEQVLSAGGLPGVVEPTIAHHVEVAGAVRFWVEFFKVGSP